MEDQSKVVSEFRQSKHVISQRYIGSRVDDSSRTNNLKSDSVERLKIMNETMD